MADIDQIIAGGAGATSRADFSGIGDIPEAYWKGRDRRHVQEGRDLFKGGVPLNADGTVNWGAVSKALIGHGDVGQGVATENTDIARQQLRLGAEALKQSQGYETGQPLQQQPAIVSPPSSNRSAATPVAPPLNRGGLDNQPQGGGQVGGPPTIMKILAAQGIPNSELGRASESIGRQLGVNPTDPIDINDQHIRNVLVPAVQQLKRAGVGNIIPDGQPSPPPQLLPQPGGVPMPQPRPPEAPQQAAQVVPGSSSPIQPTPVRTQAIGQPPPVTAASTGTTAPDIPSRIDQGIALYAGQAMNPALPESVRKAATARLEFLQKQKETTPEQKNYIQAITQGFRGTMQDFAAYTESRKTAAHEDAKLSAKRYENIVEGGIKAQREIPQLSLLQEQMNDPNFFSGVGEKYNLLYKRLKSAVGIDPDAAVPQELLRKVTASNVLASLGELKGLGPIRVAEMNMAREAAAAPDNSVPANKMLVEISKRSHERSAEIADMAQEYKQRHGTLDPAFDKQISDLFRRKPMFSDAEIKDWHKIIGEAKARTAPPPASQPKFGSPSDVHAAVAAGKLKSGDPFTDATGKTRYVP